MTSDEIRRCVGAAVDEARGRVPVIAGIIADSSRAALERAEAVADLDVAALQVTPVHYVFRPDDNAMVRFFAGLGEKARRPVLIYNVVPWSYLQPPLLARILRESEWVVGVKQSAADMKALADLLLLVEEGKAGTGKRIFSAVDALLYPSFLLGAHGAIAAVLTAAPEWSVALWNAVQAGDHGLALALHRKLLKLWDAINEPNLPANTKTAMAIQGRPSGLPRAPMPPSSPAQAGRIRAALFGDRA
jgi:4-hydroxy-tetrahydrodipicolinate synthase